MVGKDRQGHNRQQFGRSPGSVLISQLVENDLVAWPRFWGITGKPEVKSKLLKSQLSKPFHSLTLDE